MKAIVYELVDYKTDTYKKAGTYSTYSAARAAIRKTLKQKGLECVMVGPVGPKLRYYIDTK